MPARVTWNPAPLSSAILRAFPPSVRNTTAEAQVAAAKFTRKSGATYKMISSTRAIVKPTAFGWIYEQGREGGYPIFPKGVVAPRRSKAKTPDFRDLSGKGYTFRSVKGHASDVLTFGPGQAAAYAFGGAMAARPYVKPAGVRWAQGGFQRSAVSELRRSGFGGRR
jgi:hypothetical protein